MVDLIAKFLNLTDLTTNGENFGFLLPEKTIRIVDFIIDTRYREDFNVYQRVLGKLKDKSIENKTCFQKLFQIYIHIFKLKLNW